MIPVNLEMEFIRMETLLLLTALVESHPNPQLLLDSFIKHRRIFEASYDADVMMIDDVKDNIGAASAIEMKRRLDNIEAMIRQDRRG